MLVYVPGYRHPAISDGMASFIRSRMELSPDSYNREVSDCMVSLLLL